MMLSECVCVWLRLCVYAGTWWFTSPKGSGCVLWCARRPHQKLSDWAVWGWCGRVLRFLYRLKKDLSLCVCWMHVGRRLVALLAGRWVCARSPSTTESIIYMPVCRCAALVFAVAVAAAHIAHRMHEVRLFMIATSGQPTCEKGMLRCGAVGGISECWLCGAANERRVENVLRWMRLVEFLQDSGHCMLRAERVRVQSNSAHGLPFDYSHICPLTDVYTQQYT